MNQALAANSAKPLKRQLGLEDVTDETGPWHNIWRENERPENGAPTAERRP